MVPSGRNQGFTLIELMIVVAIIGIIAGIAVPNLMSSRAMANDRAVLSTLRSIITAQTQCRQSAQIDVDGDGITEAASLQEMAGSLAVRGTGQLLAPPILSASLGQVDNDGHLSKHGYYIALYLPDAAGVGLATNVANLASVDPDFAESYWSCLAWPRDRITQGASTYFVNQNGEILTTKGSNYVGKTSVPPAGAALLGVPPNEITTTRLAISTVGADGNRWTTVR